MPTEDKEKRRQQNLRYREAHPETKNIRKRNEPPATKRRWNIMTRYKITEEDVERILASQDHKCAICDKHLTDIRIDHDHGTGKVRGILCHRCNLLIAGIENDDFHERAISYLEARK